VSSSQAEGGTGGPGLVTTARALQLQAPRQLRLVALPRPVLGPHQVRVAIKAVGICGSDLTSISGALPFTRFPIVPGHEASGVVIENGPGAVSEVGWRVLVHPILADPDDPRARRGEVHHCASTQVLGVVSRDGAYADEVVLDDYMLRRMPDAMDFESGALVEPTAVAVRAVSRVPLPARPNVLLLGSGSIGLLAVQAARALGAARVVVADIVPERLALALALGADEAVNVADGYASPFQEEQFDLVVDGVGTQSTMQAAIEASVRGGAIVVYGVPHPDTTANILAAFRKDLTVATSRLYGSDIDAAIELVAGNRIRVKEIVTHHVRLDETADLVARMLDHTERPIKAVIVP
jgi:L-iditol 2-dehydrogenase